jgi:hypothetical protein
MIRAALRHLTRLLRDWREGDRPIKPPFPEDPYAYQEVRNRPRPGGTAAAIALAEPAEDRQSDDAIPIIIPKQ